MTRDEIINQGRPIEPNCFETDREEQWYNVGLYDGATAIHWHSVADGDLPPRATGLLHLGFPRCFVLIPNSGDFYFSTYEEFRNGISQINWLDPKESYTEREKEEVLTLLWNFSVEQERLEEELYSEEE